MKVGTDAVLLGCFAHAPSPLAALDIGTGSGVIALQLAQRFPHCHVDAVDLDAGAAVQAQHNFERSPWSDRLKSYRADVLSWEHTQSYDLLVCNPPFYPTSFPIANAERKNARVQSQLSFEALAKRAWQLGTDEAWFWYILPQHLQSDMEKAMRQHPWHLRTLVELVPITGKTANRVVAGWSKLAGDCTSNSLTIRSTAQAYSEAYLSLTRDFYLFA